MATYTLTLGSEEHELEVEEQDGGYRVKLGDTWYNLELERMGDSARYSLLLDKHPTDVFAEEGPNSYHIVIGARSFAVTTPGPLRGRRSKGEAAADMDAETEDGEWVLTSPMAGVVQDIMVEPGDEVEKGQVVIVVEAMKMQNDLHVRRAGTVKAVYTSIGERVEQGSKLLVVL
jgi:biotin carboxyl carrier protein